MRFWKAAGQSSRCLGNFWRYECSLLLTYKCLVVYIHAERSLSFLIGWWHPFSSNLVSTTWEEMKLIPFQVVFAVWKNLEKNNKTPLLSRLHITLKSGWIKRSAVFTKLFLLLPFQIILVHSLLIVVEPYRILFYQPKASEKKRKKKQHNNKKKHISIIPPLKMLQFWVIS